MSLASALAAGVLAVASALPSAALPSTGTATPTPSTSPAPGLTMVAESPVVGDAGTFTTELRVGPGAPAGASIAVAVSGRLSTRTGFMAAVGGKPPGPVVYRGAPTPVAALALPDGNVAVRIPVNPTGAVTGPFPAFNVRGSAVYPVSFQLQAAGAPIGAPLVGFLVYAGPANPAVRPLAVSLTVPLDAPVAAPAAPAAPLERLPEATAAGLDGVAGALAAHPAVPVTVAATPDTVARLAAGTGADRAAVAGLAQVVAGPSELLGEPYVPIDRAGLLAAGAGAVVSDEDEEGTATLQTLLHRTPSRATAVVDGPVSVAGVQALAGAGATRFVVVDADLSALPAAETRTTYGRPAVLGGHDVPTAPVVGFDAPLSQFLAGAGDPVLDAVDLLAGLTVTQQEAPSAARGVALAPPPAAPTPEAATVLDQVLAGLADDPFVTPVTADGLFRAAPPADPAPVRTPVDGRLPAAPRGLHAVEAASGAVAGLASVVPGDDGARRVAALRRTLLLAAGSATADAARAAAATAVARQVRVDEAGIGLPGPTSVTLTARKGTIPLTILSNPGLDAHLLLQVRSAKLAFLPFDAGGGPCRLDRTGESCPLVLSAVATTIRLPVETRTSGVFPLDVELRSPDGRTTLAGPVHDTVRSTAFSNVGVVLIVLALLGLAGWWARDLRHGRRAHQLVEPRTGELPAVPPAHPAGRQPGRPAGRPPDRAPGDSRSSGDDPGDVGRPSAGEASWLGDDPEVARFFATPPPAWQPASPFGPSQGPNP